MTSKPIDGVPAPVAPGAGKPVDGAPAPPAIDMPPALGVPAKPDAVAAPDVAAAPGAPGVPAAPGAPEDFAGAHRELLADPSIQFDLPRFQPPEVPGWLRWLTDFLSGDHPVLNVLLWSVVAAAVLLILYFLVRRLMGTRWPWRRRGTEAEEPPWRPDAAPARALLQEADALAAQGRFAEAAHLLLFRSIEDIDARRPDLVRPALTSRDIAALDAIPGRPRGAFARIAMLVERGLFARRPLAEADWRDCRSAYEEFAFAEGWRG